jgi:hypothetical protein
VDAARLDALRAPRYLLEIGAVAAFMLWFSERTWVHHYVSFLLTLCAAGAMLSDPTQSERTHRLTRAALIVFSIVTLGASEAGRLFGPDGVDWAKGAGVFLWPSVFVTMAAAPWGHGDRGPPSSCDLFPVSVAGRNVVHIRARTSRHDDCHLLIQLFGLRPPARL